MTPAGSSRSSSGVPSGPKGLDQVRSTETPSGIGRTLDREGYQQAQAVAVLVAVADHRQAHLAVLEARHGRREEARVEEDVGLDGPVGEVVELLDQVEAGAGRIDGELARRPLAAQDLDMRGVERRGGQAAELGDHRGGRGAARFLQQRDGGHQAAPSGAATAGTKIAMTMPSRRQTVKESVAASKTIEAAVAMAAPHRPRCGINSMLSATLRTSVTA